MSRGSRSMRFHRDRKGASCCNRLNVVRWGENLCSSERKDKQTERNKMPLCRELLVIKCAFSIPRGRHEMRTIRPTPKERGGKGNTIA